MTKEEKEDLLWQADHASDDFDDGVPTDIREIVNRIHEAYCKRKEVLDNHFVEEHKKKEARKWIGQERKQMPKTKEMESEAEQDLRMIEEEEEQAAAASASPWKQWITKPRGLTRETEMVKTTKTMFFFFGSIVLNFVWQILRVADPTRADLSFCG